ncbi:MAG: threonylcarbamoyl-AMP synthase [Deltaproteobacteria bacterium]|nr:threonylcarbamoyl-AMP synthase [Deltaproteobacteria bacterium]
MAEIVTWRHPAEDGALKKAVRVLEAGGVVACPTETFYALMVDPFQEKSLERLMAIKDRPEAKALLVLVADCAMVARVAREIPPLAVPLMAAFWPGPLTLIMPARPGLSRYLTGGSDTIGVRQSGHFLARRLPLLYGGPLTGTSANLSGRPPLLQAEQVERELGNAIELILADGPCLGGLPSTILNVVQDPPRIIRAGAIGLPDLAKRVGRIIS